MEQTSVPEFLIYGVPDRPLDPGFLHVETVSAREYLHHGHISAHKHPQTGHITFWTKGSGRYVIEDREWDFSAPAVGFVPSGVVHTHLVEEGADAIVMSMSNDALHAIAPHTTLPLDLPTFCVRGEASAWRRLAATVEAISEEYADQMPGAQAVLLSLMAIALTQIARLRAQGIDAQPADSLVLRLRRTIDQHYRDRWRLADYVAALGTTEHLLDSAARRTTGLSVNDLVMERRVLEAKRLLMFTNRAVEDIAYELGFGDPSYFTRFFRRRAGATPSAWRAERQARR